MTGQRVSLRGASWKAVAAVAVLIAIAGLAAFSAYWFAAGGRWLVVDSPSMGRSAPVGTLLWIEPVGKLHDGDVISFHPPGSTATYTHRIHGIAANGEITTKGDGNPAPDPWLLHRSDVTGVVALRWWAVGWLIRAAPLLVIGTVVLSVLVTRFTALAWRLPAATVGVAVLLTLAVRIYRPLMRAELVSFEHVGPTAHAARATYVSTGLMPIQVSAPGARPIVLHDGEFGSVLARHVDAHGRFSAAVGAHLGWPLWVALMALCFLPAAWSATVGLAPDRAVLRAKPAG